MSATQRVSVPKLAFSKDKQVGYVVLVAGGTAQGGKPTDIINLLRPRLTEYGCLLKYHRASDETQRWITTLPPEIDFVVCCYDMCTRIQKQFMEKLAKQAGVPVLFCTRRWATLQVLLAAHGVKRLTPEITATPPRVPEPTVTVPPPVVAAAPLPSGPPEDPDEVLMDLLSQDGLRDARDLAVAFKRRTQKQGWNIPMLKQAILGLLDAKYLFARDLNEQLAKDLGLDLAPYFERERATWERDARERETKTASARETREAAAQQRALDATAARLVPQAQAAAARTSETVARIEQLRKEREAALAAAKAAEKTAEQGVVPPAPLGSPVAWQPEFRGPLTQLLETFPSCLGRPYAKPIDDQDALRFFTLFQERIHRALTLGNVVMQLHFQLSNQLVKPTPLLIELRRALGRLMKNYKKAREAETAAPTGAPRGKTPQVPRAVRLEAEREQLWYLPRVPGGAVQKWAASKVVARLGHCSPGWIEALARALPPSGNPADMLQRQQVTLAAGGKLWVYDLEQALVLIEARKKGKARFGPKPASVVLKHPDVGMPSPRDPVLPAPRDPGVPKAKTAPVLQQRDPDAPPPATLVARAFAAVRDGLLDHNELAPRLAKLLPATAAPLVQKALAAVADQLFTLPQAEAWLIKQVGA